MQIDLSSPQLTCQTCVSTGMAPRWSKENNATQSATLGPTPSSSVKAVRTSCKSQPELDAERDIQSIALTSKLFLRSPSRYSLPPSDISFAVVLTINFAL